MPVTLSNGSVAAIIVIVVSAGIAVGIIHDQSIKGVYSSFSSQVSALQEQTKFTFVQGTVSMTSQHPDGTPVSIFFDGPDGSALSSMVVVHSTSGFQYQYNYQLFLKSGVTYGVRVNFETTFSSAQHSCAGIPVVFTPSGVDETQDFQC